MNKPALLGLLLLAQPAAAAPALYHCDFDAVFERKTGLQARKKPIVKEYIYDPAAGAGVIVGSDLEVLAVKGPEALSFVAKSADGSVESTTISLTGATENRFPAVFSAHHMREGSAPQQWYGYCRLSQRG